MNADQLLKHFDRISEAPDAVARLRRFVLDLAVRGKLVAQVAGDEPAEELINRIQTRKDELIAAGEVPQRGKRPPTRVERPYEIPATWCWSRLAEIGAINPRNIAADNARVSFVPMPMIHAKYGRENEHDVRAWFEIKKGYTHFKEGDVGLAKITPCFENGKSTVFRNLTGGLGAGTTELHIVRPIFLSPDYVLVFLKSSHFIKTAIPMMTGTAGQKRVPKDYFSFSPFPLPPLAEQHRIVAKVDELMAVCDELEQAQSTRENRRDRLVAATLHCLNNADTEPESGPTFKQTAGFYLNHLPRLTTKPEHIQQLRQTILNLAVRGKLVPQDPADEPAQLLIRRILIAKESLVATGVLKRAAIKPEKPIANPLFVAPDGWLWVRWDSIAFKIGDIDHKMPHVAPVGVPYVSPRDFRPGNRINFEGAKTISLEDYNRLAAKIKPDKGDIIYPRYGTIGENRLVEEQRDFLASYSCAVIKTLNEFIDPQYQFFYSISPFTLNQALEAANKATQPNVGIRSIMSFHFPLPPLAEQRRIAAKVNEMMNFCDRVAVNISNTSAVQDRLIASALKDVLIRASEPDSRTIRPKSVKQEGRLGIS